MANKTVYPYGTGGSLPSSIGLINDLVTGGVRDALTAEQGKVIGDYLFNEYEAIDLSQIVTSNFSLGANYNRNAWTNSTAKHKVVDVTPGDVIKITISGNGNFYGFLSNYEVPTSATSPVSYANGTSRVWANAGTFEVTVPTGTQYLCITLVNGDGYSSSWQLARARTPGIEQDFAKYVNIIEDVDVASLPTNNCSLGTNNVWISGQGGVARHKVIPVTPQKTYYLRATNSDDRGNFYGWLTSLYVPPTNGASTPYCSGTNRVWLSDSSGWNELTAPTDAAYLCVVNANGDGNKTTWLVKEKNAVTVADAIENYTIKKSDVVNNLYEGGVDVPLSAEQGKVLRGMYSDGFPVGIEKHQYSGAMVKVGDAHQVGAGKVATVTSQSFQGGACFGDYLFMFTENNTTCWIYNLSTNTLLQTYTIPSAERGFVSNCHCNTVNFGTEKYDANDPFPLIYVSTGYASGGYTGALVYRVVATTENNATTYSLTLVQTLKMPGEGWTEFVVGEDGCCYLCYTTPRTIYKMKMPKLSDGDITFDLEQAITTYQFTLQPSWYNGSRNQNRMYHNGKIYMVSGVPASSETSLFIVLDLATETREVEIDLVNTLGLTSESETCFIWQGHICVAFRNNANVYALYFE